jgi:2-iminobutanoate/2-iminopropanoate deaminase
MRTAITTAKIAPPVGPFSAAVASQGIVFVSGQVGQDPATGRLIEGGIAAEAEQAFRNLAAILAAGGKSLADVTRVGVYLTSMADFAALNSVYARYFEEPYPARTTVAVAALPLGARVELDAVAH